MQFYYLFFILSIRLLFTSATSPNQMGVWRDVPPKMNNQMGVWRDVPPKMNNQNSGRMQGYDCGNTFFSDEEVNKVLLVALQNPHSAQSYIGRLYSSTSSRNFLYWPISKELLNQHVISSFRVVYRRDVMKAIDVIALTITNDFTKCIRRVNSNTEPSTPVLEPESRMGFLCSHIFLSDKLVQNNLNLAIENLRSGMKYPAPYKGPLFPEDSGLLKWPIWTNNRLYRSGNSIDEEGSFFLVMNTYGKIVDVAIKGYAHNSLRCAREKQTPYLPWLHLKDDSSKKYLKTSFRCGNKVFDANVLKMSINLAESKFKFKGKTRFPESYVGAPFNHLCWLWPISLNGKLFEKGSVSTYRLIFDSNGRFMNVGIVNGKDIYLVCEDKKGLLNRSSG